MSASRLALDYRELPDLEKYLFEKVAPRFAGEQSISAFDFFCIVIWKANRAKSKIAAKLQKKHKDSLENAARTLTREINQAKTSRQRLEILINGWGFRLPMASAILTILYPTEFTVYDIRVCDELKQFHGTQNKKFETLWGEYQDYISKVRAAAPPDCNLRDADKWLWGKSFAAQLNRDIKQNFRKQNRRTNPDPSSARR